MGDAPNLELNVEQKKQKTHWRVVDGADGTLKARSDVTDAQVKKADALVIRRDVAKRWEARAALNLKEAQAEMRRRLAHLKCKRAAAAAAAAATQAEAGAPAEAKAPAEADADRGRGSG